MASAKRISPPKQSAKKVSNESAPAANGKPKKKAAPRLSPQRKAQAVRVLERLKADYPGATCALENETPFELLIATILSAQCTDVRVNMVTPELFRRWPDAKAMAKAPIQHLEKAIQSTGFYRNKAKNIKAASQAMVERHGGDVPRDIEAMITLPGVGRKTANVVLGTAFGMATGVVVDTHVTRLSKRLGLTDHTDAGKIEQDLMHLIPQNEWVDFAHRMIFHGRQICDARKPKCTECSMQSFCPKIGVEIKKVTKLRLVKNDQLQKRSVKNPDPRPLNPPPSPMILSGQSIRERLGNDIIIDPYDEGQLNPNSYNLTLHNELMVYEELMLDMARPNRVRRIEIPADGLVLSPNQLYLARTSEKTTTHNLVPQIEGRSSIGRLGLFVHVTAGFGDVGFSGYWTLEMFAIHPVRIYPGIPICQIFYHEICGPIEEYASKYQHNRDIQPSLLFEELNSHRKHDPQLPLFGIERSNG